MGRKTKVKTDFSANPQNVRIGDWVVKKNNKLIGKVVVQAQVIGEVVAQVDTPESMLKFWVSWFDYISKVPTPELASNLIKIPKSEDDGYVGQSIAQGLISSMIWHDEEVKYEVYKNKQTIVKTSEQIESELKKSASKNNNSTNNDLNNSDSKNNHSTNSDLNNNDSKNNLGVTASSEPSRISKIRVVLLTPRSASSSAVLICVSSPIFAPVSALKALFFLISMSLIICSSLVSLLKNYNCGNGWLLNINYIVLLSERISTI